MEESLRKVHAWPCVLPVSHFARRRNAQLSCGFHGTPHKPYTDVGKVTLDDKNLFVEGLGQSNVLEQVSNKQKAFHAWLTDLISDVLSTHFMKHIYVKYVYTHTAA